MKPEVKRISEKVLEGIRYYMSSEGPGGQQILDAFMQEFEALGDRSPANDPTNIRNHLAFLRSHITATWDDSIMEADIQNGQFVLGVGTDEILGFTEDRSKLKHHPVPTAWVVYLIRGVAGRYAFVGNELYQRMWGRQMPGEYAGGFLITKSAWRREQWDRVGSFEQYEHPACGAPPIPFFENVLARVDMKSLLDDAIQYSQYGVSDAAT
jgi:hypothetical protein